MKKKLALTLPLFGIATVMAFAAIGSKSFLADASSQSKTIVSDNFNDAALAGKLNNKKWTSYTEKTGAIAQTTGGESYVVSTGAHASGCELTWFGSKKLMDITSVSFDIKLPNNDSKWSEFNVYNDELTGSNFGDINEKSYNGDIIFNKNSMTSWKGSLSATFDFNAKLGVSITTTWITIKIDVTSKTQAKLNACVAGGEFVEDNAVTLTLKNAYYFKSAIVGFQTEHGATYCLDNFTVVSGEDTYSTSFETLDFSENEDLGYITKNDADPGVKLEGGSALGFYDAEALDLVTARSTIAKDTSIAGETLVVSTNFKLKIPSGSSDVIGICFGISPELPIVQKNSVVIEFSATSCVVKEYGPDGQTSNDANNTFVLKSVLGSAGSEMSIEIYKSGTINILENQTPVVSAENTAVAFDTITNYDGLFGVAAITNVTTNITVDDIEVINSYYYVPVTKSVTHNFSNGFWGNEGFEDFFVRQGGDYTNVYAQDGRLVWDCATDGSFFGSAYQYDSFILDFKLMTIKTDLNAEDPKTATIKEKWIGLDLARQVRGTTTYGSYCTLITNITREYDASVEESSKVMYTSPYIDQDVSTLTYEDIKSTQYKGIPYSWFEAIQYKEDADKGLVSASDAICFRYVSDAKSVKLYAKRARDIEFQLFAEFSNIELNGYFCICCTGYTFMELDDFSMANTSSIYICGDNEEPDTITETVVVDKWDDTGYQVNWLEELRLNANVYVWAIILAGVFAASTIGLAVILIVKTKKGKK